MMKRIFCLTALLVLASSPGWADDYQSGYSYGYDNGSAVTNSFQFNAGAAAADDDRALDDAAVEHQQQESNYSPNYLLGNN